MRRLIYLICLLILPAFAGEPEKIAAVQIFTSPDCPIANSYAPELKRLSEAYRAKKVTFRLVYPETTLSEEDVENHRKEYGLDIEATIDRSHSLVKAAGVTTTPEAAVFDSKGELVYRGRIDNLYADFGDRRREATVHYVRDVLDSLIAGEKVAFSESEPIGCLIEPSAPPSSN